MLPLLASPAAVSLFTPILLALNLLHSHPLTTSPSPPRLRLTPSGTFQIAAFSDLHYGEDESTFGPAQDINSTRLAHHVLSTEHPDLAILNGDLVTGENTFLHNASAYLHTIVRPFVAANIPWASTYGNHDSKHNLSRRALLAAESLYPHLSHTRSGPAAATDGITNYLLPVYAAAPSAHERPVLLLHFLDSRGGVAFQSDPANNDNIPNWVSARTAAWFAEQATAAEDRWGVLPSLAFVHIPLGAHAAEQRSADVAGARYPGMNKDVPVSAQGIGNVGNNTYAGQDEPLMRALLGVRGLHSVYVGHDHGDSWCGLWPGKSGQGEGSEDGYAANGRPFLCFCKPSGFGGYGTWNRGVRQIRVRIGDRAQDLRVDSWVRMQWGDDHAQVVTNVTLNSTYGTDVYPTADGGYHPY